MRIGLGFREAIGMKMAIATIRSVVEASRLRCIDVNALLWILDELDRLVDRVVREGIAIKALELGRYLSEEMLANIEKLAKTSPS